MKKLILFIGIISVLGIIQIFTYRTIADKKLAALVIDNLKPSERLKSDTILFSWIIATCGNYIEEVEPYDLKLYSNENFVLLQNKLNQFTVVNGDQYDGYSNRTAKEKVGILNARDWIKFVDNLYIGKGLLTITSIEEHLFQVMVTVNWNSQHFSSHEEDKYVWVLFTWIKIK